MFNFSGKIAVVTGGAGALGSKVAEEFLSCGASVVILDIREDEVRSMTTKLGDACDGYVCDLTDEAQVKSVVSEIIEKHQKIDILANIAGGFTMGGRTHETELSVLEKMLSFNLRTMFTLSKHVLPHMVGQKSGKIVNIGARAGLEGSPQMGPYVLSKASVIRTTETMAREYIGDNINVNCILPGTIDTDQNRKDMPDADFDEWVKPEKLANVILFLSSDLSSAISGASVPVFGKTL